MEPKSVFETRKFLSRRTDSNRQPSDYAITLRFGRTSSPIVIKPVSVGYSVKVRCSTIKATPAISLFQSNLSICKYTKNS